MAANGSEDPKRILKKVENAKHRRDVEFALWELHEVEIGDDDAGIMRKNTVPV